MSEDLFKKSVVELLDTESKRGSAIIWRDLLTNSQKDVIISYEKLYRDATIFSEKLRECGVPINSFVAFTNSDSAYFCIPVVILGILKHKCAFVPVFKKTEIVQQLSIQWIIKDKLLEEEESVCKCKIFGVTFYLLKTSETSKSPTNVNYAYAITTSGTTGKTKVVQVPHKAIVPNIVYLKTKFDITSEDVVLQTAPPTFDPFIVEMFLAFYSGATLLMVPRVVKSRPQLLFQTVSAQPKPTIIQATPSLICNFGTGNLKCLLETSSELKVLAFGGEACPTKSQLHQWKDVGNKTRIFNLYGVTEVSCWSTCEELDFSNEDEIFLGEALPFNQVQVRSTEDESVLLSGTGQIFLSTQDRMCTVNGEILENQWHATGDLARVRPDGKLTFAGRMVETRVLKKLGQKVSLSEIECKAKELDLVTNCIALTNITSILKIVLFVVPSEKSKLSLKELQLEVQAQLHKSLPPVAIPDAIIPVKKLPLDSHAKVDQRKLRLKATKWCRRKRRSKIESEDSLKRIIREAWIVSLGLHIETEISHDSLFISSGGDSAKALLLYGRLLMAAGIPDEKNELLTTILEKSFVGICDCFHALLLQGTHGFKLISEPKEDSSVVRKRQCLEKWTVEPNNSAVETQILYSACRGQSTVYRENMTGHRKDANMDECPKLKEHWRIDFLKCIDASPLLLKYTSGQAIVCVGSHSGKFSCIDVASGKELWSIFLDDRIEATASVSNCGRSFFIGCYDGALYSFNALSGAMNWKFQTDGMIKSSAVIYKKTVLFGSYDQTAYCLDQKTGALVWKLAVDEGAIYATPCLIRNMTIIATLKGTVICVDVESGKEVWKRGQEKPYFSSPLKLNEEIVAVGNVSGLITFLNILDGNVQQNFQADGDLFSSFVKSGSKLYYANKTKIGCYDFSTFSKSWDFDVGGRITSTPFVMNNAVAIARTNTLLILNLSHLSTIQEIEMQKEIFSSPVLTKENYLIYGCRDNYLYCYKG